MNVLQKLRLAKKLSGAADEFEEGIKMKNSTKIASAIVAALTAIITASPDIQHAIASAIASHPALAAILTGISSMLALLHDPKADNSSPSSNQKGHCNMRLLLILCLLALVALLAMPAAAQESSNIYAAGISTNPASSSVVGGFGLYAHQVTGGTYAVSLFDVAPLAVKPFNVSFQASEGVAQKLFTIRNVPVYSLAAVGVGAQGQNVGFAWTGGGAAIASVKGHRILFGLRFTKQAASNGAGYQLNPAVGYVF